LIFDAAHKITIQEKNERALKRTIQGVSKRALKRTIQEILLLLKFEGPNYCENCDYYLDI
jgi:hypothetical protein